MLWSDVMEWAEVVLGVKLSSADPVEGDSAGAVGEVIEMGCEVARIRWGGNIVFLLEVAAAVPVPARSKRRRIAGPAAHETVGLDPWPW